MKLASQCGRLFGKDSKKFVTTWLCVRKERMKGGNRDSLAMPKRSSELKRETAPEKNNVNFTAYLYVKYEPKEHAKMCRFQYMDECSLSLACQNSLSDSDGRTWKLQHSFFHDVRAGRCSRSSRLCSPSLVIEHYSLGVNFQQNLSTKFCRGRFPDLQ